MQTLLSLPIKPFSYLHLDDALLQPRRIELDAANQRSHWFTSHSDEKILNARHICMAAGRRHRLIVFAMFRTDNWHFTLKLGTASQKPVLSFERRTNLHDQCHPGELVESLTCGF